MQFSAPLLALAAFVSVALAQTNPFTITNTTLAANVPFDITWTPTTSGTITLLLKEGPPSALTTILSIASGIDNSGSFSWTPTSSLISASDYAFEIIDDTNSANTNYVGSVTIDTPVASSTGSVSSSTSTGSSASSTMTSALATTTSSMASSSTSATSSASSTGSTSSMSSSMSTSASTSNSMTTSTSASSMSSSTATSATTAAPTNSDSGSAGAVKVGGGMLAFVGAIMMAL